MYEIHYNRIFILEQYIILIKKMLIKQCRNKAIYLSLDIESPIYIEDVYIGDNY